MKLSTKAILITIGVGSAGVGGIYAFRKFKQSALYKWLEDVYKNWINRGEILQTALPELVDQASTERTDAYEHLEELIVNDNDFKEMIPQQDISNAAAQVIQSGTVDAIWGSMNRIFSKK